MHELSVVRLPPNMEHEHRHKFIRGKMVLLLVFLVILFPPLVQSRSVRGCEEEFPAKEGRTEEEETKNSTSKEEQGDLLTFTLLHVNDIHSHFEEVNVNTGTCKVKLAFSFQNSQTPQPTFKTFRTFRAFMSVGEPGDLPTHTESISPLP